MCDPDLSGSTVAIVKQVLQLMCDQHTGTEITYAADATEAWEYWIKVSGNVREFTTSSSAVPASVAEGNDGIGLCIDYYGIDKIKADTEDVIGYTYGGATTVSPDPAGILLGATHLDPAKRFMDYLTSAEGQTRVGLYRTPANYKANTTEPVPRAWDTDGNPTTEFPVLSPFSPSIDGGIHSRIEMLFSNYIVQNHDKLKDAWKAINDATDASAKADALEELLKKPSDCNMTLAGIRALQYKEASVLDNWKTEGATNFDAAKALVPAPTPTPGFEAIVLLLGMLVFIPLLRKKE
jgi:spermidine/putrescine-binding protein